MSDRTLDTGGGGEGQPAPVEIDSDKPGDVLGSYELVRVIGTGSMGRVFLARNIRSARQVAIKILKREHVRDSALVQRFCREALTVNEINHEHIVEVFDVIDEAQAAVGGKQRVYLVMELLAGESLAAAIGRGSVRLERILSIVKQIASALAAAHARGVVHRDLTPANVFLIERAGSRDYVKVLDFGVAKLLKTVGDKETSGTMDGAIVGTPTYMSPEQAGGLAVDRRSDVYALGTVLYELLSGKPPFQSPVFGTLMVQVITQPPPKLPSVNTAGEKIPPRLAALAMKCLAKNPDDRFQSMEELLAALEGDHPIVVPASSRAPVRRTGLYAAGAVAAALVLCGVGYALRGAPAKTEPAPAPVSAVKPAPAAPTTVSVQLTSEPAGASVVRVDDGAALGVTPLSLKLPRGEKALAVRFALDGYRPLEREVQLSSDANIEVALSKLEAKKKPGSSHKKSEALDRDGMVDPFAP